MKKALAIRFGNAGAVFYITVFQPMAFLPYSMPN